MSTEQIIQAISHAAAVSDEELLYLITQADDDVLHRSADRVRQEVFGRKVYIRGLIEYTNYCRCDCFYCGIRRSNTALVRYRTDKNTILSCCRAGYQLGFRTFVLQGGEDPYYNEARICDIVGAIKDAHPDCAVTLSLGEWSRDSYLAFFHAGADRYLLRHETAGEAHFRRLHPKGQSLSHRKACLYALKEIGYQVGSGFMVGSPGQTAADLLADLRFLQQLNPEMIGIGPFIPHAQTPFRHEPGGSLELTLRMISILRLLFPQALLPATTALATIHPTGRELGLKAGANVVMPNLSPVSVRSLYSLYDGKVCTGEEAAQCIQCLSGRIRAAGYEVAVGRGDHPAFSHTAS